MRPVLLVLTFVCCTGWSQPAQQQAQPPIVVKVEMPPTPQRDFLGYLQALGPLIAALVAVGVGLMQWHLQKEHLKQQMFAKRFLVYSAVRRFVSAVIKIQGTVDERESGIFLLETKSAKVLFGSDVTTFINEIERAIPHETHQVPGRYEIVHYVSPTGPGDAGDPLTIFIDWGHRVEVVFLPYLKLHHDQSWLRRLTTCLNRFVDQDVPDKLASRYDT